VRCGNEEGRAWTPAATASTVAEVFAERPLHTCPVCQAETPIEGRGVQGGRQAPLRSGTPRPLRDPEQPQNVEGVSGEEAKPPPVRLA